MYVQVIKLTVTFFPHLIFTVLHLDIMPFPMNNTVNLQTRKHFGPNYNSLISTKLSRLKENVI